MMQKDDSTAQLPPLPPLYGTAMELIDAAHGQDPNRIDGPEGPKTVPYELHYARKMTKWLAVRSPEASSELQLACRAQHFKRWELPRSSFPQTRPGYLLWRAKQKSQAANAVAALLASDAQLPAPVCERVAALVRKHDLDADAEAQALEDVACLVFLDDQLDAFDAKPEIDEDKMVGILTKSWAKMSDEGRRLALNMQLSARAQDLVAKALHADAPL